VIIDDRAGDLRRQVLTSIASGQITGWASAVFDATDRRLVSCEVLARCRLDDGRLHSPETFAWALDGARDWIHLDLAMLESAIELLVSTRDSAVPLARVAWNTAPASLSSAYVDVVRSLIADAKIAPSSLCLELTEHLPPPGRQTVESLLELHDLGVILALDDIGSSYAPLRQLRDVPFDLVKLERSLIADLRTREGRAVVGHTVRLAHDLGAEVVAEGIETHAELDICLDLGCDYLQGFLLGGQGVDTSAFADLVNRGRLVARR
jgi:EAL domain-containing protein (putative c-di-GMP-specific phosphodiesterase class I)